MKKTKILFIAVLVFAIIFLVSSFVTGFFHRDPDLSPFEATVTVGNAVPTIISIFPVIDTDGTGTATDVVTALDGDAGDNVNNAEIRFLVEDTNGIDDLPGSIANPFSESTAPGQLGNLGVNIEVYVTNPGLAYPIVNTILDPGSCVRLATCPDAGGCATNQMEFSCTVPMDYFFESGTWVATLGVADGAGATAINFKPFTYLSNAHFALSSGLSWPALVLSSTDQKAAASLDLTNFGNIDFASGTVHGSNLTPDGGGTGSDIPVTTLAASVSTGVGGDAVENECAGASDFATDGVTSNELSAVAPVPITAGGTPSLIFGDGAGGAPLIPGESLYFCIWEQLDAHVPTLTLSESQYSSTVGKGTVAGTAGHAWDLALAI